MNENARTVKIMLEKPYFKKLLENSYLTKNQLIMLSIWKNKKNLGEKIADEKSRVKTPTKTISKGSFYRSLSQARGNVRKSIVTLLVATMLQLIDVDDVSILMNITNIISEDKIELNRALINKIIENIKKI